MPGQNNPFDKLWRKKYEPLRKSNELHTKRIQAILFEALSMPQTSSKFWNAVDVKLNKEFKILNDLQMKWNIENIPIAYRESVLLNSRRAAASKARVKEARENVTALLKAQKSNQIVTALYTDAIASIATGLANGRRNVKRLTRMTQQALIRESIIDKSVADAFSSGNIAINKIYKNNASLANQLLQASKDGKFISVNGRNYKINSYAELVTRTKWHEAQSAGAIAVAENYQTDLIRVSSHNTTTVICQEFEGKIYSISGKNKDFPSLGQAPPFHPNCLHFLSVVFIEALEASGTLKGMSDFSKGKTDIHPTQGTFVPVPERRRLAAKIDEDPNIKSRDRISALSKAISGIAA